MSFGVIRQVQHTTCVQNFHQYESDIFGPLLPSLVLLLFTVVLLMRLGLRTQCRNYIKFSSVLTHAGFKIDNTLLYLSYFRFWKIMGSLPSLELQELQLHITKVCLLI